MKPATLQRCGVGVDGLNIQGCAMSACVPDGIAAKTPVLPGPTVLWPGLLLIIEPNIHSGGCGQRVSIKEGRAAELDGSLYGRLSPSSG